MTSENIRFVEPRQKTSQELELLSPSIDSIIVSSYLPQKELVKNNLFNDNGVFYNIFAERKESIKIENNYSKKTFSNNGNLFKLSESKKTYIKRVLELYGSSVTGADFNGGVVNLIDGDFTNIVTGGKINNFEVNLYDLELMNNLYDGQKKLLSVQEPYSSPSISNKLSYDCSFVLSQNNDLLPSCEFNNYKTFL